MLMTSLQKARNRALEQMHATRMRYSPLGCWDWPKLRTKKGYGYITYDGFRFFVHRLSFEHYLGLIPYRQHVLHRCDNPACCNPQHLFLGSHAENMQDMVRKRRHARQAK